MHQVLRVFYADLAVHSPFISAAFSLDAMYMSGHWRTIVRSRKAEHDIRRRSTMTSQFGLRCSNEATGIAAGDAAYKVSFPGQTFGTRVQDRDSGCPR